MELTRRQAGRLGRELISAMNAAFDPSPQGDGIRPQLREARSSVTPRDAAQARFALVSALGSPCAVRAAAKDLYESASFVRMMQESRASARQAEATMECQSSWMDRPRGQRDLADLIACDPGP